MKYENVAKFVNSKLHHVESMNVEISFKNATETCHVCEGAFQENLNNRESLIIPIFHNLSV